MNKQEVIEKVQKILRKADTSNNNSLHEVEVAMSLAQKMLKKHHMSMSQILSLNSSITHHSSEDLIEHICAKFKSPSVPKWMSILISAINQITETKNLIKYGIIDKNKNYGDLYIVFVGMSVDVEIATELFNFLKNCITKLASKYVRERKLTFREWRSFAEGCSSKLLERSLKNSENFINKDNNCDIENFTIDDEDEIMDDCDIDDETDDERIEEDDFDIESREINDTDGEINEETYSIYLVSKEKKIDDFIKNLNEQIKIDDYEASISKKLDQKSFNKGSSEAEKLPLKVLKQIRK